MSDLEVRVQQLEEETGRLKSAIKLGFRLRQVARNQEHIEAMKAAGIWPKNLEPGK